MKKILSILLFLLLALGAGAQRFEWAKGYLTGEKCEIVGSVVDSVGNLYFLGEFLGDACWDAESFLPTMPVGGHSSIGISTVIAKISPSGEMIWRKPIYNMDSNTLPWKIILVGDTAIACMVDIPTPPVRHFRYYLDTLVTGDDVFSYPAEVGHLGPSTVTAYIVLDLDGNVKEQHFLYLTFVDNQGDDLVRISTTPTGEEFVYYSTNTLCDPSFDIDGDGNIYIVRKALDQTYEQVNIMGQVEYSVARGNISAVKCWDNGRLVGVIPSAVNIGSWYPQLMKFSPHFDTLLAYHYLIQDSYGLDFRMISYVKVDAYGNPYVFGTLNNNHLSDASLLIDDFANIYLPVTSSEQGKGYLIKLDSNLTPLYGVYIEDSVINPEVNVSGEDFYDINFDYDSNLLFINAGLSRAYYGDTNNFYAIPRYRGHLLSELRHGAFFLALRPEDGAFYSYGRVQSKYTSASISHDRGNSACGLNRFFMQLLYTGGIRLPSGIIDLGYGSSLCYVVFDYQGHVIGGEDYQAPSSENLPCSISLRDSVLYLSNYLESYATFGDFYIPTPIALAFNCVAKYVDPAFMTPYVAPPVAAPQAEAASHTLTLYPNPVRDRLHIDGLKEPVTAATALNLYGQRIPIPIHGNTLLTTHLPAGVYFLELKTIGQQLTFKFIKL